MFLVEEQIFTVLKLNATKALVSNISQLQECQFFSRNTVYKRWTYNSELRRRVLHMRAVHSQRMCRFIIDTDASVDIFIRQ